METHKLVFDSITEQQAAEWLGISIEAVRPSPALLLVRQATEPEGDFDASASRLSLLLPKVHQSDNIAVLA